MAMRVIISGATGFIGRALCRDLHGDYEIVALSRDAKRAADIVGEYAKAVAWDAQTPGSWAGYVEHAHAIVNLTGESIADGRWTQSKRDSIMQSRTDSATAIVEAVRGARNKPAVVVQISGIGYYGSRGDEVLDEDSSPGAGFLAEVSRGVEAIVARVEESGVRHAIARAGVVLGREGGALPRLMAPFRFYLGGHAGSGRQWISWISLPDMVGATRFLMNHQDIKGPFNVTSPNPVTMKHFCRVLGQVLHSPAWTFLPGFAARLAFGAMADETLLASQRAIPKRLVERGFQFQHPDLHTALDAILQGEEK